MVAHEVLDVGAMLEVLATDVPAVARRVQRLLMPSLWPSAHSLFSRSYNQGVQCRVLDPSALAALCKATGSGVAGLGAINWTRECM